MQCSNFIDPATSWFEIHQISDKRSDTVANVAEQEWFCRYPWPTQITYERGNEFLGKEFQEMVKRTMEFVANQSLSETPKPMP